MAFACLWRSLAFGEAGILHTVCALSIVYGAGQETQGVGPPPEYRLVPAPQVPLSVQATQTPLYSPLPGSQDFASQDLRSLLEP